MIGKLLQVRVFVSRESVRLTALRGDCKRD